MKLIELTGIINQKDEALAEKRYVIENLEWKLKEQQSRSARQSEESSLSIEPITIRRTNKDTKDNTIIDDSK